MWSPKSVRNGIYEIKKLGCIYNVLVFQFIEIIVKRDECVVLAVFHIYYIYLEYYFPKTLFKRAILLLQTETFLKYSKIKNNLH